MKRRQLLRNMTLMLGGVLAPSAVRAMLWGADGVDAIQTPRFDDRQRALCHALADLIIPQTDTPGAIEAGVPQFIELMVSDWYTDTERGIFFTGLQQVDAYCQQRFSRPFVDCGDGQRIDALTDMESAASEYRGPTSVAPIIPLIDEHQPFFTKLKELTVLGYYTSEVGCREELKYLPMPMEYRDIDFADVGRQWSY
jgi:hypothetical protein